MRTGSVQGEQQWRNLEGTRGAGERTGSVQGEQQWRKLEGTRGRGGVKRVCPGRAAVEESGRYGGRGGTNWICPGRAAVEESGRYEGGGRKLDLSRESSSGGIWKVRGGRGEELDLSWESSSGGIWKVRGGRGENWICPGRAAVVESGRYEGGGGRTGSVQGELQWKNLEGTRGAGGELDLSTESSSGGIWKVCGGGGKNWICPVRAAVEESGRYKGGGGRVCPEGAAVEKSGRYEGAGRT